MAIQGSRRASTVHRKAMYGYSGGKKGKGDAQEGYEWLFRGQGGQVGCTGRLGMAIQGSGRAGAVHRKARYGYPGVREGR